MDILNTDAIDFAEANNNVESIKGNILDIENSVGNIAGKVNKISDLFGATLSIGTFSTISKMIWEIDSSMTKIAARTGKGKQGAIELKNTVSSLQKELGATAQDAVKLVSELSKKNYIGNIKEAAKYSYQFSEATGLALEQTANLTNSFSKIAKMTEKEIREIYKGVTTVQQANGLSEEGMTALGEHINENITNMIAFGRTKSEIHSMTVSTAKLVSSFEKVGISAQTSLGWVQKLTNPDDITENIGLYSQLGISMTEALSGGDISENLMTGMKSFGERLKSMGPIAGAAYAKAFGVSYNEAIKAADAESPNVDTENLSDMEKLVKNTEGLSTSIQKMFNKIIGVFNGIAPVMLIALVTVSKVFSKKVKKTASVFTDSIEKGLEKTISKTQNDLKKQKGIIGSLFDTSEIKKARTTMDELIGPTFWEKVQRVSTGKISDMGRAFKNNLSNFEIDGAKNTAKKDLEKINKLEGAVSEGEGKLSEKEILKLRKEIEKISKNPNIKKMKNLQDAEEKGSKLSGLKNTRESAKKQMLELEALGQKNSNEYKNALKQFRSANLEIGKSFGETSKILSKDISKITQEEKDHLEEFGKALEDVHGDTIDKVIDKAEKSIKNKINNNKIKDAENEKGITALLKKLGTRKDKEGNKIVPQTRKQIAGGIGKNVAGGLGKGLMKIAGPLAIISAVLSLLQGPIEALKEKLAPHIEKLSNFFTSIFGPVIDILGNLVIALLPTIMGILKTILLIASPFIGILGFLASLVVELIAVFKKGEEKEELKNSAKELRGLGQTLRDSINSTDSNTEVVEKSTEENKKGVITTSTDGSLVKEAAVLSSSSENETVVKPSYGSNTKVVVEQKKSQEETRKEDQDRKVNEAQFEKLEEMATSLKIISYTINPFGSGVVDIASSLSKASSGID